MISSQGILLVVVLLCCNVELLWGSQADYHLLKAAENGDVEAVKASLRDKGASVKAKNNYGVR